MMMIFFLVFNRKLLRYVVSPQVNAKQSWILDSTLRDLDSLSVKLGFRFQSLVGFQIPIISGISDSNH